MRRAAMLLLGLGVAGLVVWQVLLPLQRGAVCLARGRELLPALVEGTRVLDAVTAQLAEESAAPGAYARQVAEAAASAAETLQAGVRAGQDLALALAPLGASAYLGLGLVPLPDPQACDQFLLREAGFYLEAAAHLDRMGRRLRFLGAADRVLEPFLELDAGAVFAVARPDGPYREEFLVRARALWRAVRQEYRDRLDAQEPPSELGPFHESWVQGLDALAQVLEQAIAATEAGDLLGGVEAVQAFEREAPALQQRVVAQQRGLWRGRLAAETQRVRAEAERQWEGVQRQGGLAGA
ncbi:MAG TPA: hypothetical protein VFB73_01475 [Chloroflexota bacterium]|nr:hypothetical protein [Chloroflexota bacterium]